jgi:Tfp pilus assembly protein PilF
MRAHVPAHRDHLEALRFSARIARERNALPEAERLLESILTVAPQDHVARADYARVLIARQRYLTAREQITRLLEHEPGNAAYRLLQATVYAGLAEHERAIALYEELLADAPGWPQGRVLLGHSLKAIGKVVDALAAYRAAAAARPGFGDAYWSLANLKTYRFSDEEIERMRLEEASAAAQRIDRYHLCFALGKALEDRGEYGRSWEYYRRGNALKLAGSRYRKEFTEINTRRQIEVCTAEFFENRAGAGAADRDPILIVGLPRAGSTLIEQILASHTQVEGTQELFEVQRIVLELQGADPDAYEPRYPGVLTHLSRPELCELGARYLSETRAYRHGKPFFIDKMPNNFRHIGLIHLILPHAKIIDVRREPMACCFSNFKQLFASGQDFTYSVENIASYYRTYLELMRHWDTVLPGRVLHVFYEELIEDLPGSVRRILEFCGLEFQPACLEFHRTQRSVSTASSQQVRQPLFRGGLSQWRHFEPWLAPLREALGDAPRRYRE